MDKTTKIILWSVGGLAVATGLFFAIRALLPKKNGGFNKEEEEDYQRLLKKEKEGTLNDKEKEELEKLKEETHEPGPDEVGGSKMCPSTFKNNSKGICVAKMQLAMNEKHDNSWSGDGWMDGTIDYPCEGKGSDLLVDGDMGPNTMKFINKYYPSSRLCVAASYGWQYCYCTGSINKSVYNKIIKGVDTSNAALKSAGYEFKPGEEAWNASNNFSGYSNAVGGCKGGVSCSTCDTCGGGCKYTTCNKGCCQQKMKLGKVSGGNSEYFNASSSTPSKKCNICCKPKIGPPYALIPQPGMPCKCPKSDPQVKCKGVVGPQSSFGGTQYSNFTLSNKNQLSGEGQMEWRTMEGVMGDFYPNSYGFIDKPFVETNLEHSYGMRNFGGDVSINLPYLDLYGRKL